MSNPANTGETIDIDVNKWVEEARRNPVLFQQRKCTDIVLTAIGLSSNLSEKLILKGGTLMALAFGSERATADIDFTSIEEPEGFADNISEELNARIPEAINQLGYLDITCRVQSVEKRPRPRNFENMNFPALLIRLGYAQKGGKQEEALSRKQAANIVEIEISFRDQVFHFQELYLEDAKVAVRAFSLSEIIAEKFRALFQQVTRNRYRRQDVYDIAYLIENENIDDPLRSEILEVMKEKCLSRKIDINADSIFSPEVKARALADWDTLKLEVPDLPDFEEAFSKVSTFYRSLPWSN